MLTNEQRAELDHLGPEYVRSKLAGYGGGRNAAIGGFKHGDITRSDIEEWLAEKNLEQVAQQSATLFWAKIAAWAGIVSVIVAAIGVWLQK